MSSNSNINQLVLFDDNDDQMEIFDDITQLSKIPLNCLLYIFSNQPQIIQEKLLDHLFSISRVCIRQSSNGQSIMEKLHQEINNYSFILFISGENPSYEKEFHTIWKKYGRKKLFVKQINDQVTINIKDILAILNQHKTPSQITNNNTTTFSDYLCVKCDQSFHSNDDLQQHYGNHHSDISTNQFYLDSTTNISSHKKTNQNDQLFAQSEITCSICNDDFKTNGELKKHMKTLHAKRT